MSGEINPESGMTDEEFNSTVAKQRGMTLEEHLADVLLPESGDVYRELMERYGLTKTTTPVSEGR